MKLVVYDNEQVFAQFKPVWNDLLHRSITNRIFSTWEWQSKWWDAYRPGKLFVIACYAEDDRLIALAPWFIEDHPERGRVIRSIGCVDVTDYLDVIIDTAYVEAVLSCLAECLQGCRAEFDLIDLCNIPETSPTYQHFPKILQQHGFSVEVKQQEVCPVITLPADWEAYLSLLDKKQRHELRRKLRIAEGAEQPVAWYIVGREHDLNAEIERFLFLMAASDPRKAEFLKNLQNQTFFKGMMLLAQEQGWLQMSFLTVGGEACAAYVNFDYGDSIQVYNSGLHKEGYDYLSPGIVLLAYNIRHAIENGRKEFDFLRGNESYKYRLGGKDTAIYMLMAEHQG